MIPKNWEKIDESQYKRANEQTPDMICTDAFTKKSYGKNITILFYELGDFQPDTFAKMKQYIDESETSLLDIALPNAPDFEDTSFISYLYDREFEMGKHNAFMTVSRVLVGENQYSTVCQINYEKNGKLCNAQSVLAQFDKTNVNESLQKDGTVAEIFEYLEVN